MNAQSPTANATEATALARQVAEALWRQDRASQHLGMRLLHVGDGEADVGMTVHAEHCNGFGTLHGGLLAALADSAFAMACNSRNELTVAAGFDINIVQSALAGQDLIAQARRLHQGGRSGVYDVTVCRGDEPIAHFRGRSQRLTGRKAVEGL
jgi:acyl-CoA thioesterase